MLIGDKIFINENESMKKALNIITKNLGTLIAINNKKVYYRNNY